MTIEGGTMIASAANENGNAKMFTIIDVITPHPNSTGILKEREDSLLLILEPQEISQIDNLTGRYAYIQTPNNLEFKTTILGTTLSHGVVGIYVEKPRNGDIVNLSKIRWALE